jgi:hypothetical protein
MRCTMLHPLHSIQNCNIISMYTVVESADANVDGFGSDGDVRECSFEGDEALDDGGEEGTRFEMEAAGAWGNELRRKEKRGNKKKGKKKGEKHSLGHRSDRMRQQVLGLLLQHSASVAPQLHACNSHPPLPSSSGSSSLHRPHRLPYFIIHFRQSLPPLPPIQYNSPLPSHALFQIFQLCSCSPSVVSPAVIALPQVIRLNSLSTRLAVLFCVCFACNTLRFYNCSSMQRFNISVILTGSNSYRPLLLRHSLAAAWPMGCLPLPLHG